ncbi:probable tRNA (uracil-O(2)-)-methyltransferase [Bombina bombina]|uniref:probable tRNA (uracil-O(2)-)-methyltransferase n=1 Tax=Bombina bombina TaxID=8345 RepID=UPI00235A799B|nr:probable tRNA (uracil-O(2)-)-methyltransferase [Bombina bombina]
MPVVGDVRFRDPSCVLPGGFWAAISVWLDKPQVLNKRLCGSSTELKVELSPGTHAETDSLLLRSFLSQLSDILGPGEERADGDVLDRIREYWNGSRENASVTLRVLIPKANPHYPSTIPKKEGVIQDITRQVVTFLPLEEHNTGHFQVKKNNIYQIRLEHVMDDEWSVSLHTLYSEDWDSDGVVYPKITWMKNELLSKIAKWSIEDKKSEFKSTLSLIPVDKYSKLYQSLKEKYKDMVKVWPEVTDPEKFVYEDVAIATYLLILWEEDRELKNLSEKQTFVDLGCGNGLLVHILSNEGHHGRGIDVRKRNIWDMYGPQTILQESAIMPNDDYLFPNTDWIIGNHSDELTPWIPVIAARSSYSCCFFVLPCCFFNFYGKYNRKSCKKTQYREYLDFVTEVGNQCGFNVEEDCLRIPSTKRVCLIGKSRTYLSTQEAMVDEQRRKCITSHKTSTLDECNKSMCVSECTKKKDSTNQEETSDPLMASAENWISGFQPRDKVEQIKNCSLLPRDFIDKVVLQVAKLLLNSNKEEMDNADFDKRGKVWNTGRCLTLREIAEVLDKETLQRLKNECGGLQTLFRNNHQVFEVMNSSVSIRDWRNEAVSKSKRKQSESKRGLSPDVLKTRLCWFFINHPDGCPRVTDNCPYAHGSEELRPSSALRRKKHRNDELS